MEFKIIITTKNRECLIFRNFKFHFSKKLVSGSISWRCVKKYCTAHNYEPSTIEDLNLLEVRGKCKRKSCEDLNLRPNKIIRMELSSCILAYKNEQFKFVDSENNIILITCKLNLNFLCNYNTHIFGNGTFTYYRPSYFYQMYGIHGYKNGFYIPLIIALLPSKSFDCYLTMWNFICELRMKKIQQPFNPISMKLDFEIAAHQDFRNVFNNSTIKECRFQLVKDAFFNIQNLTPDFNLSWLLEFSDYILYNYIIVGCKFPPSIWAESPSEAPRTTNCVESFHKHFNVQFYSPHPPITNVIENLKLIQVETYLKIKAHEVNKGTVKPKRNEEKERIEFACTTWTEYEIKNITRLIYQPNLSQRQRCIRNGRIWAINRQVVPCLSGASVHISQGANVLLWGANRL
ncbi:hypothetical protein QTP88_009312 [Uroleucon formosanum]